MKIKTDVIDGPVVEVEGEFSLAELCIACAVSAEWIIALVEEGVIEPLEEGNGWRFGGQSLIRAHTARRLQIDLGVNRAGAALALELLDEIDRQRERLALLESLHM